MNLFKDAEGRTWHLAINVAEIRRVRGVLGCDLLRLVEDGFRPLGELLRDPVRFVDLLYVLCQKQADERQLSDEDFGRGLGGDTLGAAIAAFQDELFDFFPDPRQRAALKKVQAAQDEVMKAGLDQLEAELAELDPKADVEAILSARRSSGGASGAARAS